MVMSATVCPHTCFPLLSAFFFNDPATTEIYTLSPTRRSSDLDGTWEVKVQNDRDGAIEYHTAKHVFIGRSEEHTSELQSRGHLVCRLLLEKKKKRLNITNKLKQHETATKKKHTT